MGATMKCIIDHIEFADEGKVIATRLSDEWLLFVSDYDGNEYWVHSDIVYY